MTFQTVWYFTDIPVEVVEILEKDLTQSFDSQMEESKLQGDLVNKKQRKSSNAWIPAAHWSAGFLWHYVQKANRENFLYDLTGFDNETIQYTRYQEGEFYSWHNDAGLAQLYKPVAIGNQCQNALKEDFINKETESIRKLSFVLQLSDHDSYEGGNLQLLDECGRSYFAPRKRGAMILFDSRTQHRVLKVKKGTRKSLVGWIVGPRWK